MTLPYPANAGPGNQGTDKLTVPAGAIVVGANYKYGVDPGSMLDLGSRRVTAYDVGAGCTVASGLTVNAQYDYVLSNSDRPETAATGSPDDKAHVIVLRTVLAF